MLWPFVTHSGCGRGTGLANSILNGGMYAMPMHWTLGTACAANTLLYSLVFVYFKTPREDWHAADYVHSSDPTGSPWGNPHGADHLPRVPGTLPCWREPPTPGAPAASGEAAAPATTGARLVDDVPKLGRSATQLLSKFTSD